MPFGVGSRVCFVQHFAMTELKVVLSLILSKFCFSLSSAPYQHSPAFRLVLVLEHGVSLRMRTTWHFLVLRKVLVEIRRWKYERDLDYLYYLYARAHLMHTSRVIILCSIWRGFIVFFIVFFFFFANHKYLNGMLEF